MGDKLDERIFGAIIRSMLNIARTSENHTWFLEKEDLTSGEFTDDDWRRFLGDVAWMTSQHPALHIESIIEIPTPDWRDADDYVAAFYGRFPCLFDKKAAIKEVWRSYEHRHTQGFLGLPFPLTLIYIRKL